MFFMGGMTLGYLHPPVRAKDNGANLASKDEDKLNVQPQPSMPVSGDGAIERTLLWARRILC